MSRKIIISLIILVVILTVGCGIWYMSSNKPIQESKNDTKIETFAPGTYKVYKNDELGFSFKYPKEWYLEDVNSGSMLCQLSNFDPDIGLAGISEDKLVDITISATRFPYSGLKNKKAIRDYFSGYSSSRLVREMNIKGGRVCLIKKSLGAVGEGREFDLAYLYLPKIKDAKNNYWDYVIRFLPFRLGNNYRDEYFKLLMSIEIINK